MAFRFKRFFTYFVLYSFFFQTLWPSVVFARVEVPLGATWQDNPSGLMFKITPHKDNANLARIEAFVNPKEEWVEQVVSPPKSRSSTVPTSDTAPAPKASAPPKPSSSPKPAPALEETLKKLLDRVVNIHTLQAGESDPAYALYNNLVVTEDGISWAFGGLGFVLDRQWNVVATGTAGFDMAVKICTRGTIGLDNLFVKQVLARGKTVSLRGTGGIERLDAWAIGDSQTPGTLLTTEGSDQTISQLYIHQGRGENRGHLTVKESLHQTGTFENYDTLTMARNSVVKGGTVFSNSGKVEGEVYQVQSALIRNSSVGPKKATMTATQSLKLEAQKLEQKGDLSAPTLDLSAVAEIEDSADSTIKTTHLKTALKRSWTPQGTLEVNDWQDTSDEHVFIQNKGIIVSHQKTSIQARFRTLAGGKSDLAGVNFKNSHDRYQTLVNEGETLLRKVEELGYHKDIDNRAGGSLVFLDCGYSWHYQRDENGVPTSGGLHLGTVRNAGTIAFGGGTYRTHGLFTNTTTGVHEILDGQELWMEDLINDGVKKAKGTYRIDQRLGVFTKLGKVLVDGKLITQMSERAIRGKTGGTTWNHTGHIQADDWEDESDKTITINNTGTIITKKSATLSAQFVTGRGGTSDLRGVSFADPLYPHQALVNQGKMILRQVKSLGSSYRSIVNERGGKLAFLEGEYSHIRADSKTGGLIMGDVTNHGHISFGGGDYYTGVFTNHDIHEALSGQKLWSSDFINHGETRTDCNYLIDMTRGTFTKLGKMVIKGQTTIQFAPGVNAGQYLTNNNAQNWELEGSLKVEAPYFHNTVDLILKVPFYLWVQTFLNDATLHTKGFTLKAQTFGQGTLGGSLGFIKSGDTLDIEVEGDVNNQRGKIEVAEEAEVVSKNGDIFVGQGIGSGHRQKNGAYIMSHKKLRLKSRNMTFSFGEVGSSGPLSLEFANQLVLESARIKTSGETLFQGKSAIIKRADPWTRELIHPIPDDESWVCNPCYWNGQHRQKVGGDASEVLGGANIRFLVDRVAIMASRVAAMDDITDKRGRKVTQKKPGEFFVLQPYDYRAWAQKSCGPMEKTDFSQFTHLPIISTPGAIDLDFSNYDFGGLLLSAAELALRGDNFMLGSNTQQGCSSAVALYGRLSLMPALLSMLGGMIQYRSAAENPYVVYSMGSFKINRIDPVLITLVKNALSTLSFLSNPTADPHYLRQLMDPDSLLGALQLTLMASTRKSYLYPRKGAAEHIGILLENARKMKKGSRATHLSREVLERSEEPTITFEEESIQGETALVPYLYLPKDFINERLFENSRGTAAVDEGININVKNLLSLVGGVMATKKKDIDLKSGGNMSLGAAADTHQQGRNSHQTKVGGGVYADEGRLNAESTGGDLDRQALKVKTRDGAKFKAKGKGVDASLPLHDHYDDGAGTTTDRVTHEPSRYQFPDGKLEEEFEGDLDTYAQDVEADSAHTIAFRVTEHAVQDTVTTRTHTTEGGGIFGGSHEVREERFDAKSKGSTFKLKKPRTIKARFGDIILEGVDYKVPRVLLEAPNGVIQMLARKHLSKASRTEKESSPLWMSMSQDASLDVTYDACQFSENCIIDVHSKEGVLVEGVQGKTLEWLKRLQLNGGTLTERELIEMHLSQHFEAEGPTAACGLVISLAVSMCTAGAGAGIGMAVAGISNVASATAAQMFVMGAVQASFMGICSQTAVSLFTHQGDMGKVLKDITSSKNLKSIGLSAIINGATMGLGKAFGTPGTNIAASQKAQKMAMEAAKASGLATPTLAQSLESGVRCHLQHHAIKTGVSMAVNMGAGKDPEDVLKFGVKGLVAGVIGAVVANRLSEAASPDAAEPLNPVIHKFLHGGLGAGTGAIMDGERGAKAGALGAFVAETVATMMQPDLDLVGQRVHEKAAAEGLSPTDDAHADRIAALIQEEMKETINIARLSGAISALLTDQDVSGAEMAATNAVENNWLLQAVVVGALTADKIQKIYKLYRAAKAAEKAAGALRKAASGADKAMKAAKAMDKASSSAGGGAPDPDPDDHRDHEGEQWDKNEDGRWHHEYSKDKPMVPNRPNFENEKLQKLANEVYRRGDRVPGGSAEMLRKEAMDGNPLKHLEKCEKRLNELRNTLSTVGDKISRVDRISAERLMRDLRDAIEMARR